jgi:NADH-quinone oxidoreductase subunit M
VAKWLALMISIAVLGVTLVVAVGFKPGGDQYQFVESHTWIPSFGTGYILGVDGIALVLVVLTAVLMPLLIIAGWNDASDQIGWGGRSVHTYFALTLAVEGMVLMSLVSLDVLLFYVFFEAMLIPMYFLSGVLGRTGRAAVKFLLYNLFGGLIILAAVIGLARPDRRSTFHAGTFDSSIVAAVSAVIRRSAGDFTVSRLMFAFAVKARCGRSTAGCPTPPWRPPRPAPC